MRLTVFLVLPLVAPLLAGCGAERADAGVPPPITDCSNAFDCAMRTRLAPAAPQEYPGIHNVFRLSKNIISGGEPLTDDALRRIAEMGVRTVLSVDGKVPNARLARELGMRYVHVPIQYTGIKPAELIRIAKTFREKPGPFFVHCFHGRHRGPAAAAIGRVILDGVSREHAIAEMRQWCGTAGKYQGLYGAVATGHIPTVEETRAFEWTFDETKPVKGLRAGMVRMTRAFDNVKALHERSFAADPEHPDIDAVNEVTKVVEMLRAMRAVEDPRNEREDHDAWMKQSIEAGDALLAAILAYRKGDADQLQVANRHFTVVKNLCATCHHVYRNNE